MGVGTVLPIVLTAPRPAPSLFFQAVLPCSFSHQAVLPLFFFLTPTNLPLLILKVGNLFSCFNFLFYDDFLLLYSSPCIDKQYFLLIQQRHRHHHNLVLLVEENGGDDVADTSTTITTTSLSSSTSWPRSSRWRERRRRCSRHSSSPPAGSLRGPRVGLLSTWWPGGNGRDYDDDDGVDDYDDDDDHVYDEKPHSAPEVWSHKTHEALHTVGPPWADGDDPDYNFGHFSYIFRWQKSFENVLHFSTGLLCVAISTN